MTNMQKQIDNVVANFPTPKGTIKMNEPGTEPTPLAIIKFTKYLQACAISIPNTNDDLGYLGMVVSADTYSSCSENNIPYTPPVDPGPAPIYTTPNAPRVTRNNNNDDATAAENQTAVTNSLLEHQTLTKQHERNKEIWVAHKAAQTALRNLITDNIDEMYIASFNDDITGFTRARPKQLLDSIKERYATVTENDLDANEARLRAPWDYATSIESLFNRTEDCKLYAEAGAEPISEKRLIRCTFLCIKNTGLFNMACDRWNDIPIENKSWAEFKKFFAAENKKIKNHTAGEVGLAQEEMANAIIDLTSTLANCKAEIASLKQEMQQERQSLLETPPATSINAAQQQPRQPKKRAKAPVVQTPAAQPDRDIRIQGYNERGYPVSYCWSCGITGNLSHSSETCKSPLEGHKKEATLSNKMGGNARTFAQTQKDKKYNK
jgi:hypothetical protein